MEGTVVVGTHPDATLPLTDATVSRYHVEFQARPRGVRVRDLDSRNGTFFQGSRVHEVTVGSETSFFVGRTQLALSVEQAAQDAPAGPVSFGRAVTRSGAMRSVFDQLRRAAATPYTVLALGETGTGKELLAEAIHLNSPRAKSPFIVVDCGAVAPTLIESELFGHVRGAFTGATSDRVGALHAAHGGTLFLDEIGELPLELQPTLLRVLETGAVRRVGETRVEKVDLRVIAATHRDLEAEVEAGRFRADLYYRLAVVVVRVPPLRERAEDVMLLVRHLLQEAGRPDFPLSDALEQELIRHAWPGNVRELRNLVHRALAGGTLDLSARAAPNRPGGDEDLTSLPFKAAKERLVEAFTREYLEALLERCGHNVTEVARTAGLARSHVHVLVNRYGLKASPERD